MMNVSKLRIAIYTTFDQYTKNIELLCKSLEENFDFDYIKAKSYRVHNYVLENADLLIIDNVTFTPDVKLVIKYFKMRNIPILFNSDDKILLEDNYKKALLKRDTDEKILLQKYRKTLDNSDGILTSEKKLVGVKKFSVFYTEKTKNLKNHIIDFIEAFRLERGKKSNKALRTNFAELMKTNNRKYRKEIFPYARLDKNAIKASLINYNSQYKDYILKMNYKELLKAYETIKKDRQPEIFKKFAIKLLKDKRPPRIVKMILDICKNPEYPLDEVMFYIIKDIPSNSRIFKDKNTLEKFIEEFCALSYEKDKNDEIIFKLKDYDKASDRLWESPDTYNIREFLKTAFLSDKNHKCLFVLLELCKKQIITREELYYETYLLKAGFVTPDLVNYASKKYIKFNRICWSKLSEKEINKLVPKIKKNLSVYDFLRTEKAIVYTPEHFFIRIKGYGKNREWGRRVVQLTDKASAMIKNGESYNNVLSDICFYTRQNALNNQNADKGNMSSSGMLRYLTPESCRTSLVTPYDLKSRYGGKYARAFKKFKNPKNALKSPYKDLCLTRIRVSKKDDLAGKMLHVPSAETFYCIKYIEALYNDITAFIGKDYTKTEFKNITKKIALLHWIIAHNAPWGRGSDSIANIFVKAILKALKIKVGSLKQNISLDLEAFCTEYKDYQKKYFEYYQEFEYIKL